MYEHDSDALAGKAGEGGPATVSGKLAVLRAIVADLAGEDWASLPATVQDEAIRVLEDADSGQAAIRGAALAAFGDGPGCSWYGHQAPTAYLTAETRVTRPAARTHQKWAKRHQRHPAVMAALGRMELTTSVAQKICGWSDQLTDDHRATADEILLGAWLGGCTLGDLAMLAAQMRESLLDPGDGKEPQSGVTLDMTTDGAGVLHGDLTPSVSALVKAAFAKYGAKRGPDDHRTLAQRQHDALGEICRLVLTRPSQPAQAAEPHDDGRADCGGPADGQPDGGDAADDGLFEQRAPETADRARHAGRGLTALVHINLAQLLDLRGAAGQAEAWAAEAAAQWAGQIGRDAEEPGYGGAWLRGDEASDCTAGARITPVVTAIPDTSVIPRLAAAGARLHQVLQGDEHDAPTDPRARYGLAADLLGWAIKALSGPGGFASYLRTRLFSGTVLGSGSLALDVGRTREIPRQLRIAVALRDRKCAKPGCDRPAAWTEPHHVVHYANGGLTNPENIKNYCWHHHHVLLHDQGWNGHMHPDGTVDLYRPDGTRYTPGVRYRPQRE